jgi:thiol-disulfide isomerase/thioredoxin
MTVRAQQFVAKAGSDLYYKTTETLDFQGKITHSGIWRIQVKTATDTSLLLNLTLLEYQRENWSKINTSVNEWLPINATRDVEQLAILQQPFDFRLSTTHVPEQAEVRKIMQDAMVRWQIMPNHAENMVKYASYVLGHFSTLLFPRLPRPLQEMSGTMLTADSATVEVISKDENSIQLKTKPKNTANAVAQIKLLFRTGMPVSGEFRMEAAGTGADKYLQTATITQIPAPKVAIPRVDEKLVDASVKSGYYSTAVRTGPEVDSALLEKYMAEFDPVIGKNTGYLVSKVGLLQSSNMKDKYQRYNAALRQVPNEALTNTHLFNKAQELKDTDPEGTYDVIKYMYKDNRSYREWIQHSFAQSFTPPPDTLEAIKYWRKQGVSEQEINKFLYQVRNSRASAQKLITLLEKDKNDVIRDEIYPLYLWNETKQHPNDKALLTKSAAQLEKFGSKKTTGNPHRYALLMYKQMQDAGMQQEATQLLDREITRMEKRVLDTADKQRFAEKNMLAFAYKLKSNAAAEEQDKMKYLAKAALYSPKSNIEKAHDAFYDRVLLNSKESYRSEFADALLKKGNTVEAMKILSDQLYTDPTMLGEVQQSFSQHLPEKDFYDFLHQVVMKSWKSVPAFTLKTPTGDATYALGDYKGKWLLLDFWGTWCGPCRQELPELNKFSQEIKNRDDLAFLSIACHDQPDAVTSFMKEKQYQFTAVMSDNVVEKNYEVKGYPSKYLISPEGVMLELSYGTDWQRVVRDFLKVKPKDAGDKQILQHKKD